MKDIPVFTSEYGAASLILKEIPYRGEAYIRIQSSLEPKLLVEECAGFCRACGAEKIYAAGHPFLESYPLHTSIIRMSRTLEDLPGTDAALWPVLPENGEHWKKLYNQRMIQVPNAAYMTAAGLTQMLEKGDGYFVHRGGELLGIGRASGETIHVVVSARPGGGRDTVLALATLLTGEKISLEVASGNKRAVKLYEKLGFVPTAELSRWHKIF